MKQSAIIRIVIYSLLILVLAGLLGSLLALHAGVKSVWNLVKSDDLKLPEALQEEIREEMEEALEEDGDSAYYMEAQQGNPISILPDDVQEIEIHWISGDLTLVPGDVEDIQLEESVSDKPLLYSVRNGKLLIKFSEDLSKKVSISLGKTMDSKDLTITVPRTWTGRELEIHSVSADVLVKDLTLEEISYQGVSGECKMENCRVGELDVETVSGDVEVTGEIRELECKSVSASCDLTVTNVPEEISMEGVSGNLKLTLPADAGFTAELEGLNKKLDTDFEVTGQNGKFVSGDGRCQIEIEGVSGNAKIRKAS